LKRGFRWSRSPKIYIADSWCVTARAAITPKPCAVIGAASDMLDRARHQTFGGWSASGKIFIPTTNYSSAIFKGISHDK
jgi:hypothetical protein